MLLVEFRQCCIRECAPLRSYFSSLASFVGMGDARSIFACPAHLYELFPQHLGLFRRHVTLPGPSRITSKLMKDEGVGPRIFRARLVLDPIIDSIQKPGDGSGCRSGRGCLWGLVASRGDESRTTVPSECHEGAGVFPNRVGILCIVQKSPPSEGAGVEVAGEISEISSGCGNESGPRVAVAMHQNRQNLAPKGRLQLLASNL